ncbi:MAG: hypothetical protein LLG37_03090 [Spirochaetia bacterium]|nr:hypothetical protein [Spirochaetia bacterium]
MRRILFCVVFAIFCAQFFSVRGQTCLGAGMGFYDGDGNTMPSATMNAPRGVAVSGSTACIADTGNHVIRKVNLSTCTVSTLAGTGTSGILNGNSRTVQPSNRARYQLRWHPALRG